MDVIIRREEEAALNERIRENLSKVKVES